MRAFRLISPKALLAWTFFWHQTTHMAPTPVPFRSWCFKIIESLESFKTLKEFKAVPKVTGVGGIFVLVPEEVGYLQSAKGDTSPEET